MPGDDVVEIDTIWAGSFASAGFTLDLTDFLPASVKKQIAPPSLAAVMYQGQALRRTGVQQLKALLLQ